MQSKREGRGEVVEIPAGGSSHRDEWEWVEAKEGLGWWDNRVE